MLLAQSEYALPEHRAYPEHKDGRPIFKRILEDPAGQASNSALDSRSALCQARRRRGAAQSSSRRFTPEEPSRHAGMPERHRTRQRTPFAQNDPLVDVADRASAGGGVLAAQALHSALGEWRLPCIRTHGLFVRIGHGAGVSMPSAIQLCASLCPLELQLCPRGVYHGSENAKGGSPRLAVSDARHGCGCAVTRKTQTPSTSDASPGPCSLCAALRTLPPRMPFQPGRRGVP